MKVSPVVAMATKTILLINSDPNVRELVQDCLNHWGGWQIISTGSPIQGLQQAIYDQPDAIILDLARSGMDYLTFFNKLKADPATQMIPVVIVTAGAKWLNFQSFQQFQVVGAIDYSSDPSELSEQIAKLLKWSEKTDENPAGCN